MPIEITLIAGYDDDIDFEMDEKAKVYVCS